MKNEVQFKPKKTEANKMADKNTQDYFDNNDEGHMDTREKNFQCEKPDKHLGCDLGIDVQG